ncbi:hypothetical protein BJ875DRAFT_515129 [Amylocarpus encephaloides]|uniref:Uncharacterized protein n=1 Tax=Amylocarpus encephaloides TaxID=45428 RepID=A0A9P7YEY0_9HELO|nr:hypothetical protein BJ875DRAFT_515129 [Amylocarpus encephaloides]
MSSSTALLSLLPKDPKKLDHPIFLRICYSPWATIDQETLLALRLITSAYLTFSFVLHMSYEMNHNKHGWLTVYEFANISYFLQAMYSWIAFTWTFMHLHYPHHGSQTQNSSTRMQKFFSPPRQSKSSNKVWFSIFYYAVNSLPHVATGIYWFILVPKGQSTIPGDQTFGHGWLREFYVTSKFGVNSIVALMEIAVWAHIFGTTFLSLAYVGWAYVGYSATGKFGYYFFDHNKVGWDDATAAIMVFCAACNTAFVFVNGLTASREQLTKKCEQKSYDYISLPQ